MVKAFTGPLAELKEYQELTEYLTEGKLPVMAAGCMDSQKCHLIHALGEKYPFRLIITYSDLKAKEICEDYKLYSRDCYVYPAKDVIFFSADIHGNTIIRDRLRIIRRILENRPVTVVASLDGGLDRVLPLVFIRKNIMTVTAGERYDLEELIKKLTQLGYERQSQVESPGEFAVRGGILDIFPLTEEAPYRIEFWDDEIDSIRTFDVNSQRSIENVERMDIYPAAEIILDESVKNAGLRRITLEEKEYEKALRSQFKTEEAARIRGIIEELKENLSCIQGAVGLESYIRYFYEDTVSFFDYFDNEQSIIFLDEPGRIEEKGEAVVTEFRESMAQRLEKGYILPGQADVLFDYKELLAGLESRRLIILSTMEARTGLISVRRRFDLSARSITPYNNNFELLIKDLTEWKKNKARVILLTASRTRAVRLSEDLRDNGLTAFYTEDMDREVQPGEIMVAAGALHRGFEYPLFKFVMISESDIFGAERKKKKKKSSYDGQRIKSSHELVPGDYVVHENHGIGIYRGIEKIEVDRVAKDYIKIEYGGGGVLYILATGLDVIQKFAGGDAKKPKLNKLNSIEWKNTKTKVKSAVKEIAQDLVLLYAARQKKQGFAFSKDTVWQTEFEEMFPYQETEDQLRAIEDTKRDMESTKIMDRLICGDVGYGKTEIAIRAAFKAVSDGKQVAFLVPTTILAQQHYNTFVQRMMDFPISVDMMSRFKTAAEQKKTLERLKKGSVDILIGTHRILSKDVEFKDLGLLIIDEEQRFGVTHKEKIKQMKENVDVLTLTATPIPRTLHMSLSGIRDMSVLDEPPLDRLPIQTYVLEHNDELIREAISRELSRNGQVYYVYNRVQGIEEAASSVAKLVPEANVAYAHGQMSERQLEKIMFEFVNGELDVLVSTTIIETGLDISNVNTIIIDDADRLGLSQLYQLRGRVGRSNRTSCAFLMYKRDKMLKEVAEKRLQAIKEFTEPGSGFKVAMRDLEIRGAGNLLGAEQSGHMASVGYDMYCRLLNEAVRQLKGETVEEETFATTVDLEMDAYIPSSYIRNEVQKLDMYKRIAEIGNEEEFLDMQEELTDRFGEMPSPVNNLLCIAFLKALAHSVYITSIVQKGSELKLTMYPKARVAVEKIPNLLQKYRPGLTLTKDTAPYFTWQIPQEKKAGKAVRSDHDTLFRLVKNLLNDFKLLM